MKSKQIGYWISTALVALAMGGGGLADLSRNPQVMEGLKHLGYPEYLATLLGAWKVLGAMAVLAPGLPRLKEWAYAGMAFDLTGAAFSHAMAGGPASHVLTPLVILAVVAASRELRPASRRLAAATGGAEPLGASSAH